MHVGRVRRRHADGAAASEVRRCRWSISCRASRGLSASSRVSTPGIDRLRQQVAASGGGLRPAPAIFEAGFELDPRLPSEVVFGGRRHAGHDDADAIGPRIAFVRDQRAARDDSSRRATSRTSLSRPEHRLKTVGSAVPTSDASRQARATSSWWTQSRGNGADASGTRGRRQRGRQQPRQDPLVAHPGPVRRRRRAARCSGIDEAAPWRPRSRSRPP